VQLKQSFEITAPIDTVWTAFGDLASTASCIPGAEIYSVKENRTAEGLFRVQLGPIKAAFAGEAEISRDDQSHSGTIVGAGRDGKNATRVKATVNYKLVPIADAVTRVDLNVDYSMSGPLAQIARASIMKDVASGLVKIFAGNLERMLSDRTVNAVSSSSGAASGTPPETAAEQPSINLISIIFSAIWRRIVAAIRGEKP
jgi:carbon monoxide dehydrogenase subunit G